MTVQSTIEERVPSGGALSVSFLHDARTQLPREYLRSIAQDFVPNGTPGNQQHLVAQLQACFDPRDVKIVSVIFVDPTI